MYFRSVRLPNFFRCLIVALISLSWKASATHTLGGNLSYKYLGNDRYEVRLILIIDCYHGEPNALNVDTLVHIRVFTSAGGSFDQEVIPQKGETILPIERKGCGFRIDTCFVQREFTTVLQLPPINDDYHIVYQNCCRTDEIVNIDSPLITGQTLWCTISAQVQANNSGAVFHPTNAFLVDYGKTFSIDNSATDSDGDSLSYEFDKAYTVALRRYGSYTTIDSIMPPPFKPVDYATQYEFLTPAGNLFTLDAQTGKVSGQINQGGDYLIAIACHEWRNGVMINTSRMEYVLRVCGENDLIDRFKLAPNPFRGNFRITLEDISEALAELFSLDGLRLRSFQLVKGENIIDMGSYRNGIYLLSYKDATTQKVLKLVKY